MTLPSQSARCSKVSAHYWFEFRFKIGFVIILDIYIVIRVISDLKLGDHLGLESSAYHVHPDLAAYAKQIPDFLLQSRSEGTVSNYSSYLRKWTSFAKSHQLDIFPAKAFDLSCFFMYLVDLDVSCSVVVNAFYALTWVHNFVCENENFNPLNNPLVKSVVEAAKRKVSKPSIHKPALPTECLVN